MGVDAQEILAKQLGHKSDDVGHYKAPASSPQDDAEVIDALQKAIEVAVNARYPSGRDAFCRIRKRRANKVTASELHEAVKGWGVAATVDEVEALIKRFDVNGNQLMDFHEFSQHVMRTDADLGRADRHIG